jgi:chorismate synthase
MSSSFGQIFRITTFGESHGGALGVVIDGCPPRMALDESDIQPDLDRRRPGQSKLTTQRQETDTVTILSGVFEGLTLGTAIGMVISNSDARPGAYEHMREVYRPSHADYSYQAKYGIRAWNGGGRASARETAARVAAGAVARKMLALTTGIEVISWVESVGTIRGNINADVVSLDDVERSATRCPDPEAAAAIEGAIDQARKDGDSLGGVVRCVARNVPAGLGEPVMDKIDADLAKAMLSIPAAKGFEIGSGFAGTVMRGSEHNDAFAPGPNGEPVPETNRSGGVLGGITTGAPLDMRIAFKPTATINAQQRTVSTTGHEVLLAATGRHDPCVLPRAVPIVEAMTCLVLADHWLRQRTVNVFE